MSTTSYLKWVIVALLIYLSSAVPMLISALVPRSGSNGMDGLQQALFWAMVFPVYSTLAACALAAFISWRRLGRVMLTKAWIIVLVLWLLDIPPFAYLVQPLLHGKPLQVQLLGTFQALELMMFLLLVPTASPNAKWRILELFAKGMAWLAALVLMLRVSATQFGWLNVLGISHETVRNLMHAHFALLKAVPLPWSSVFLAASLVFPAALIAILALRSLRLRVSASES